MPLVACKFGIEYIYLSEYVCNVFALQLVVTALVYAALYRLHCFGAHRTARSKPYVLGEAQQACRKVAGDVEQQNVGVCRAYDYLPGSEAILLSIDGKESLATYAVKDCDVLQLVCVLHKLLQRRLCGGEPLQWQFLQIDVVHSFKQEMYIPSYVELEGVEPSSKRGNHTLSTRLVFGGVFEHKQDRDHQLVPYPLKSHHSIKACCSQSRFACTTLSDCFGTRASG